MTALVNEPGSLPVGAAPLFRQLADDIQGVSLINARGRWDPRQSPVSPGERLWGLGRDVLSGQPPLYRGQERGPTTDLASVVGAGRRPEAFTDDRLGRA